MSPSALKSVVRDLIWRSSLRRIRAIICEAGDSCLRLSKALQNCGFGPKAASIAIFLMLPSACKSSDKIGFAAGDKNASTGTTNSPSGPSQGAPQPDSADGSEGVDVPQNISGAFLSCSLRKRASESDLSSEYGCRLNDAETNSKLDISGRENEIIWGGNISDGLTINPQSPIPTWHAIYTVTGRSLEQIGDAVGRLNVTVQWQGDNIPSPQLFKNQPITEILQPIGNTDDTTAPIIQEGIDPSDPGIF